MRRSLLFLPFVAGLVGATALTMSGRSAGTSLLVNGGFESWAGSGPTAWNVSGSPSLAQVGAPAVSGFALRLEASAAATLAQVTGAVAGADYEASVEALSAAGAGRVTLRLRFLDGGFLPLGLAVQTSAFPSASFALLDLQSTAPPGALWAKLEIEVDPDPGPPLALVLDEASLTETPAPPSTVTPSPSVGASPPANETRVPTPPRTRTPLPTPTTGTSGQGTLPARRGTPPTVPRPVLVPTAAADGNLLVNGGFELADDEGPAFWSKFGGDLVLEGEAVEGARAASFLSNSDSTKWVNQVLPVTPGRLYAGSAQARVTAGAAELFLRISWYRAADGSGEALGEDDSLVATSSRWSPITVGPVRAPAEARSARFRLMLRPSGPASALFDDARLVATAEQPTATPPAPPAGSTAETPRSGGTPTPTLTETATPRAPAVGSGLRRLVAGPMRISEIYADPAESGRDTAFEWVELVNVGSESVDLAGWQLGDAKAVSVLPAATVPPGGYVVIAAATAAQELAGALAVAGGAIGGGLNNAGDTVRLLTPTGTEVDAVSYGDDASVFDPPPPAPGPGESLGLRDLLGAADAEKWALTLAPSPGAANQFAVSPAAKVGEGRAPVEVRRGHDESPIPWLVTAAAGAVGGSAVALAAPPAWRRLRRSRRGR